MRQPPLFDFLHRLTSQLTPATIEFRLHQTLHHIGFHRLRVSFYAKLGRDAKSRRTPIYERGGAFLSTQNEAFMGGVSCAKKDEPLISSTCRQTRGSARSASSFLPGSVWM